MIKVLQLNYTVASNCKRIFLKCSERKNQAQKRAEKREEKRDQTRRTGFLIVLCSFIFIPGLMFSFLFCRYNLPSPFKKSEENKTRGQG